MSLIREGLAIMSNGVMGVHALSSSDLKNSAPIPTMNGIPPLPQDPVETEDAMIDIVPRNVVSTFSVGCHLDLKKIAWHGCNVVFKNTNNSVLMKLRHPPCTAHIWSSGKVTCTGANTEEDAKRAARKVARFLQKLGFPVKFRNYRIVNVLATCAFPFGVKLEHFAVMDRENVSYEPELHPGANYRCNDLKASLKIFSTGSVTITAPSLTNVQLSVERVYPLCSACRKSKEPGGGSVGGRVDFDPDRVEPWADEDAF